MTNDDSLTTVYLNIYIIYTIRRIETNLVIVTVVELHRERVLALDAVTFVPHRVGPFQSVLEVFF